MQSPPLYMQNTRISTILRMDHWNATHKQPTGDGRHASRDRSSEMNTTSWWVDGIRWVNDLFSVRQWRRAKEMFWYCSARLVVHHSPSCHLMILTSVYGLPHPLFGDRVDRGCALKESWVLCGFLVFEKASPRCTTLQCDNLRSLSQKFCASKYVAWELHL